MQTNKDEIVLFLFATTTLILLLAGLIITLLYFYQRKKLSYQRTLKEMELEHQKNLLTTTLEIQETTFRHISREIHDNITLSLTLAKLQLTTIFEKSNDSTTETVRSAINLLAKSIDDLSKLSKALNSDLIKSQGLVKTLRNEFDRIRSVGLFLITFQEKGLPVYISPENGLILFRIVQETFNNIIKHSNAQSVKVTIKYMHQAMILRIIDDGCGFEYPIVGRNNGAGLNNIINRVKAINGEIEIASEPGKGTRIQITMPSK